MIATSWLRSRNGGEESGEKALLSCSTPHGVDTDGVAAGVAAGVSGDITEGVEAEAEAGVGVVGVVSST